MADDGFVPPDPDDINAKSVRRGITRFLKGLLRDKQAAIDEVGGIILLVFLFAVARYVIDLLAPDHRPTVHQFEWVVLACLGVIWAVQGVALTAVACLTKVRKQFMSDMSGPEVGSGETAEGVEEPLVEPVVDGDEPKGKDNDVK